MTPCSADVLGVLDALEDQIALLDAVGNIIAVNRAWARFAENSANASAASSESAAHIAAGVRAVVDGQAESFHAEYSRDLPSGPHWFCMNARRISQPGLASVIVTHSDRTGEHLSALAEAGARISAEAAHGARATAETLFRTLTERSLEFVSILGADGHFMYVSPSVTGSLGYEVDDLLGTFPVDLVHADDRGAMLDAFYAIGSGGPGASVEMAVRLRHANGEWRHFEGGGQNLLHEPSVRGLTCNLRDVTGRTLAERATVTALREADLDRRRLEATVRAIPVGVWLTDSEGRITLANPAAGRIWGGAVPHSEPAEYTRYQCWWPDTGQPVAVGDRPLSRMFRTGQTTSGEALDILRFDGSPAHILASAAPIVDGTGDIIGGVGINVDLTEQREHARERERLLERLDAERTHLATIFQEAPTFLAVTRGPDHVFERANPAYRRLIGDREIAGRPAAEAIPELRDQGFIDLLDHVRDSGEAYVGRHVAVQIARVHGEPPETHYIDFVFLRLEDPQGDHALVAHGVDVTEQVLATRRLRDSEQRAREQFAKLPVPTYLWELRGDEFVLVDCNEAAVNSLPHAGSDLRGKTAQELFPDHAEVHEDARRALHENTVIRRTLEADAGPHTARRRWEITIGPQPPDRVLLHAVDTTERWELEAQLRQAQKMDAVGRLAGGVAHDFNNLLTVIGSHSELLLEEFDAADPRRDDVQAIHRASSRAAGLTRQLLAFSRKQILKPTMVDVDRLVIETRKMLSRLLGEDIEVVTDLAAGSQCVLADPSQLDQVLVNLALNARDAMPRGGCLTLATRVVDLETAGAAGAEVVPPGEYVVLTVRDTGIGMSATVRSRLFEPFFTTKEPGRGTGLGLATVYGIVKQSAGYIAVESTVGEGSAFHVYLPAALGDDDDKATGLARNEPPRAVETVLLVEDEESVRRVARRLLERHGYTVLDAANGAAALALFAHRGTEIDLVVTDAVMPGMSGAEVVQRLRSEAPHLKALIMSGYTDDEIVRRGISSSTLPFIQKPFSSEEFIRAVRIALGAEVP